MTDGRAPILVTKRHTRYPIRLDSLQGPDWRYPSKHPPFYGPDRRIGATALMIKQCGYAAWCRTQRFGLRHATCLSSDTGLSGRLLPAGTGSVSLAVGRFLGASW